MVVCHLIDVELWLAPGHFSVAGAELADKVVAVTADSKVSKNKTKNTRHKHISVFFLKTVVMLHQTNL